jgi:NAD(P)-dependent dehydrogenase (short-subunit alcohol dehydrogenase family)
MGLALLELKGLRALVTGAGTGLGRQLALGLAEAGADLVVCGRRRGPLEACAAEATALGAAVGVIAADVTTEAGVEALVAGAGRIDILVNNAGTNRLQPWAELPMQEWRDLLAIDLDAPFRLCQAFGPPMVERGWGRIINVVSVYGSVAGDPARYPGLAWDIPAYVVAKHGLHGLTRYLGARLARHGVCVNSLSPGMFPTEGNRERLTPAVRDALEAGTPAGRLGGPDDLKAAAVFLASPGARFVVGQNLVVDGGWTVW